VNIIQRIIPFFFFTLIFLSFYFLNYQQVYSGSYESDTSEHIIILKQYFSGEKYIPHPLWHYCVYYISKILTISIENAAVLFSSILMFTWVVIIFNYVKLQLHNHVSIQYQYYLYILFSFVILFIGPLVIPGDYIIYLGKGSPNIWHNITIFMVKPIAFLTLIFMMQAWKTDNRKYYFITYFFAILTLFAKPSFLIIFLPTIVIVAVINKVYSKNFIMYVLLLSVTSVSILLYQFVNTFGTTEVIFDYLGVWSRTSQNIGLSIALGLAFPLLFTIIRSEILYEKLFQIAWIQVLLGVLFYAFLAQSGKQYLHGNFSWSYMIAMNFIYIFTIVRFIKDFFSIGKIGRILLSFLLFLQVSIGVYYFNKILMGQHPIYISISFLRL